MVQLNDLASHLLKVELQLEAYQKLHADELAELWRALNECKREIAAALSDLGPEVSADDPAAGPIPAPAGSDAWQEGDDERHEEALNRTSRNPGQRR